MKILLKTSAIVIYSFIILALCPVQNAFGQETEEQHKVQSDDLKSQMNNQMQNFAGKSGAGLGTGDFRIMVAKIIKIALSFIGLLFLIYLVYGGFLILTAAGEEEKITKAKHIITNGVIGIAIVLSAWGIAWLVYAFIWYSVSSNPLSPFWSWSAAGNLPPLEYNKNPDPNTYID